MTISLSVAKYTDQKDEYIRLKGIDDDYAKKIILDYIQQFERAKRSELFNVLVDKLPEILDNKQKENKIKNYLQELRKEGRISSSGKYWKIP